MFEEAINKLYEPTENIKVDYDDKYFKLPIEYCDHREINNIIKEDIELIQGSKHIYNNIMPDSILNNKWSSNYTTNKQFIKDTQLHIKYYISDVKKETIYNDYKIFKEETNFVDKYQYMGIKMLKPLNNYTIFLHFLGCFNLASPALSLLSPIIALILPFFIFKLKGIPITFTIYCSLIKKMISENNFFKLFTNFSELPSQQKMSGIISIFFYIFQVYNNVYSCISFYNNMYSISDFLFKYKNHLIDSIKLCEKVQTSINKYETYTNFYNNIECHKNQMIKLLNKLDMLLPYNNTFTKLSQLGIYMKLYYDIYNTEEIHNTFMFSIFLNQYDADISSLHNFVKNKKLNKCKFGSITKIKRMYYLPLINETPVKNNIDLEKNIIITGPNASGKTTILKSLLINILLSQQIGYGCYSSAKIKLYNNFHSYLNIPDTSGRDSLFQAEARRCKDILETITNNNKESHFCIFDEIYSGTNPNDAVLCANIYLKGMNHYKECVDYALTTHYIQLCENFNNDKILKNLKMNVNASEHNITYLYELVSGISYVHGGKHILKNMDYPEYLFKL
jgi:hypothetical protein